MLFLAWQPTARAAGASADIELVRPTFSQDSLPGIDSPSIYEGGTLRGGLLVQYERDPLILYERGEEQGVVVSNRQSLHLGMAWDIGRLASVRLAVPVALQWGTDVPDLSRDGPGLGDIDAGIRLQLLRGRRGSGGLRADISLPTGTPAAWMGEPLPRATLGLLGLGRVGPFDLLTDLALQARSPIDTQQDFQLGSELQAGAGVRYHVWPDRLDFSVGYVTRSGLDFLGQAGAENTSEMLSVVQIHPDRNMQWDVGLGKGIAAGYGSTEFRAFGGITWIRFRRPDEPPSRLIIAEIPDEINPPPPSVIDEPDELWGEDELARVEENQIIIRDPIQFEFATNRILEESLPTLRYVATLMNVNWQIAHVVIEGHASEEGSYAYNYDLSIRRAHAIWEELIRTGVHPDRLSYRGMGETVPRAFGEDEASLATNRRVEFHIIKQYTAEDPPPPYRPDVKLPWSGDPAEVTTPPPPPTPQRKPPDPEERLDEDQFDDDTDSRPAEMGETSGDTGSSGSEEAP